MIRNGVLAQIDSCLSDFCRRKNKKRKWTKIDFGKNHFEQNGIKNVPRKNHFFAAPTKFFANPDKNPAKIDFCFFWKMAKILSKNLVEKNRKPKKNSQQESEGKNPDFCHLRKNLLENYFICFRLLLVREARPHIMYICHNLWRIISCSRIFNGR